MKFQIQYNYNDVYYYLKGIFVSSKHGLVGTDKIQGLLKNSAKMWQEYVHTERCLNASISTSPKPRVEKFGTDDRQAGGTTANPANIILCELVH